MLEDPENSAWSDTSVEFCGGTHLSNTQEAEAFVILEEVCSAKAVAVPAMLYVLACGPSGTDLVDS